MSSAPRLPTVYLGISVDDDDTRLIEDANQAIAAILNGLPQHLVPRVVCSILTSVCAAQDDPALAFQTIGGTVVRVLQLIVAEAEGRG